jgi:hypothetical protein
MAIKRYTATADNTITNAFEANLQTRGTGSNMGESDIVETFAIYNQVPAVNAKNWLYVNEETPAIATDGSETFTLVGSQEYVFVAKAAPGAMEFDASGDRTDVLTNIAEIINSSASSDFTASLFNYSVQIESVVLGTAGNSDTLSSSLNNTTPQIATTFAGGTGGREESKILLNFPVSEISSSRDAGEIPASGSVDFFLRVHNAPHGQTLPRDYDLSILPVSRSWDEGYGLDMEDYTDLGVSNWVSSSSGTAWTREGGDYHSTPTYQQPITTGPQDVEVNITELVEEWLDESKNRDGVGISISSSFADMDRSFYIKKFFARGSEHFYLRPKIEARWQTNILDDRGNFYGSSSLCSDLDNTNKLFIYNRIDGELKDLPSLASNMSVSLYSGSTGPTGSPVPWTPTAVTHVSTGIYSTEVIVKEIDYYLYDVWSSSTSGMSVTGSAITVKHRRAETSANTSEQVSNITNLKPKYVQSENPRLRMFIRDKDWNPTIYTVATTNIQTKIVSEAYYSVHRVADGYDAIPYGTGSIEYTKMSYDKDGNYFDLDMSLLEEGYSYGIKVSYKNSGRFEEQPELWKFRVE